MCSNGWTFTIPTSYRPVPATVQEKREKRLYNPSQKPQLTSELNEGLIFS